MMFPTFVAGGVQSNANVFVAVALVWVMKIPPLSTCVALLVEVSVPSFVPVLLASRAVNSNPWLDDDAGSVTTRCSTAPGVYVLPAPKPLIDMPVVMAVPPWHAVQLLPVSTELAGAPVYPAGAPEG